MIRIERALGLTRGAPELLRKGPRNGQKAETQGASGEEVATIGVRSHQRGRFHEEGIPALAGKEKFRAAAPRACPPPKAHGFPWRAWPRLPSEPLANSKSLVLLRRSGLATG